MAHALLSGLVAGYGIAVPVGAIATLIFTKSASESLASGEAAGLGAATADLTDATIAVAAGVALRPLLVGVQRPIHIAGGCVLVAIAVRGLNRVRRASDSTVRDDPSGLLVTYLQFLALTPVNPLTVVYFTTLVLGNHALEGVAASIAFVAGVAVASASWQTVLALGGALLGQVTCSRATVPTAIVGNGIVLALAAHQFAVA